MGRSQGRSLPRPGGWGGAGEGVGGRRLSRRGGAEARPGVRAARAQERAGLGERATSALEVAPRQAPNHFTQTPLPLRSGLALKGTAPDPLTQVGGAWGSSAGKGRQGARSGQAGALRGQEQATPSHSHVRAARTCPGEIRACICPGRLPGTA